MYVAHYRLHRAFAPTYETSLLGHTRAPFLPRPDGHRAHVQPRLVRLRARDGGPGIAALHASRPCAPLVLLAAAERSTLPQRSALPPASRLMKARFRLAALTPLVTREALARPKRLDLAVELALQVRVRVS